VLFVTHDIEEAIFMAAASSVMDARPPRQADVPPHARILRHYTLQDDPGVLGG